MRRVIAFLCWVNMMESVAQPLPVCECCMHHQHHSEQCLFSSRCAVDVDCPTMTFNRSFCGLPWFSVYIYSASINAYWCNLGFDGAALCFLALCHFCVSLREIEYSREDANNITEWNTPSHCKEVITCKSCAQAQRKPSFVHFSDLVDDFHTLAFISLSHSCLVRHRFVGVAQSALQWLRIVRRALFACQKGVSVIAMDHVRGVICSYGP